MRCPIQHKTKFKTEKEAGRAMMRCWGRDSSVNIFDMHTYYHDKCQSWHFGHISYYQKSLEAQVGQSVSQP